MAKYHEESWLREKYVVEGYTIDEIADLVDVSKSTIHIHLTKNNIDTSPGKHSDEEWLRQRYIKEKMSASQIGELVNRTGGAISSYLDKYNIETRDPHEGRKAGNKYNDVEWLYEKYVVEDLTTTEIADLCDCTHTTISRHLEEKGIGVEEQSGENHYNFSSGRTHRMGHDWEEKREDAIQRDFEACRICGMSREDHKEEYNGDIQVHHKTPRRWYLENYNEETAKRKMNEVHNLLTLCKGCHMTIERTRQANKFGSSRTLKSISTHSRRGI